MQTQKKPVRARLIDSTMIEARRRACHTELEQINRTAARFLQEGLEETLMLHRLGLFDELGIGKSLSGHQLHREPGEVDGYIEDVKRWHHLPRRPVDGPGGPGG